MTNVLDGGEPVLTDIEREQLRKDFIKDNLDFIVNNNLLEINI
ncbi:MAG: hypothetical protein PUP93_21295 [Rhizonema sp. NSF051]|nr:hypothetical protein [Rhizonema sp. NSF051]